MPCLYGDSHGNLRGLAQCNFSTILKIPLILFRNGKKMKQPDNAFKVLNDFDNCRNHLNPHERLKETRKSAQHFREKVLEGGQVIFFKTCDLIRLPYPVKYGLLNAFSLPTPYMHILNRLFIIQYRTDFGVKTLLFSPSDFHANRETPFFKRLVDDLGPFKKIGTKILAVELGTVESCLAKTGISPEQVDYISYDHLHTQDLRKWLGTDKQPAYFPNAKLLVMRQEWESLHGLLPPQTDWYCPNAVRGIDRSKIILLENDLMLGEGVGLIRTPGHTEGNHSLLVNTAAGIFISSENGVSADSYSPLNSEIPGVRKYARETGMEVILNGNTLERGLDQYISMVQEKTVAGPSRHNPKFFNVVPSSELVAYWAFPGLKPTYSWGNLEYGKPLLNRQTLVEA
jgi:hypothetical protein